MYTNMVDMIKNNAKYVLHYVKLTNHYHFELDFIKSGPT